MFFKDLSLAELQGLKSHHPSEKVAGVKVSNQHDLYLLLTVPINSISFRTDIWRRRREGGTWFFSFFGVCVDLPQCLLWFQHRGPYTHWGCQILTALTGQIWTNHEGWDWRDQGKTQITAQREIQSHCQRWLKWRWTPSWTRSLSALSSTAVKGRSYFPPSTRTSAPCRVERTF